MLKTSRVFPTRVGVILKSSLLNGVLMGVPHAGGGKPVYDCFVVKKGRYSLREWGCSWHVVVDVISGVVFPTRVGVLLFTRQRF